MQEIEVVLRQQTELRENKCQELYNSGLIGKSQSESRTNHG